MAPVVFEKRERKYVLKDTKAAPLQNDFTDQFNLNVTG